MHNYQARKWTINEELIYVTTAYYKIAMKRLERYAGKCCTSTIKRDRHVIKDTETELEVKDFTYCDCYVF